MSGEVRAAAPGGRHAARHESRKLRVNFAGGGPFSVITVEAILRSSKGSGHTPASDVTSLYPRPEGARLLVVDGDAAALRDLEQGLAEEGWHVFTAPDPAAAFAALAGQSLDVVLADMHTEAMSGASLLGAIQQRHPDVARIIMADHANPKETLRAVPFAHQFVAKPVDVAVLRWTLRRASALRRLLTNEAIRIAVGSSNEMPAAPATYLRLKQLLRDPDVALSEVAAAIERDVGISARILQLVSSAFFGMSQRVTTVTAAVNHLGVDTLRALVLALEIVRIFREGGKIKGFSLDALQRRSFVTAKLARGFAERECADDAFVAGMLHGVGQLILAERVPARYAEVIERVRTENRSLRDVERSALGATHAEVAAYLLGLWGLPHRIVEAVMHYEEPWRIDGTRFDVAGAVYLASVLAERPEARLCSGTLAVPKGQLNADYLASVGVLDRLPTLRSLARRAAL